MWGVRFPADAFSAALIDGLMWLTLPFVLPLLAGMATGRLAPARQALGTFYALAVILPIVHLGLGSDPFQSGLARIGTDLIMIQTLCWIPIGCGTSALVGWLRTRMALRPARWVLQ
jgi:hypothetical protein